MDMYQRASIDLVYKSPYILYVFRRCWCQCCWLRYDHCHLFPIVLCFVSIYFCLLVHFIISFSITFLHATEYIPPTALAALLNHLRVCTQNSTHCEGRQICCLYQLWFRIWEIYALHYISYALGKWTFNTFWWLWYLHLRVAMPKCRCNRVCVVWFVLFSQSLYRSYIMSCKLSSATLYWRLERFRWKCYNSC